MCKILAVDCCLKLTGVALMVDGKITGCEQEDLGRRQTQELPHMAESLITANGLSWESLDYVALTNGPGYFTGIRVGAAYASGLAYASGAKIIPVSSLEVLAFGQDSRKILAAVYAGHGFVYAWCEGFLEAGEYTVDAVRAWLSENPDALAVSDDPERAGIPAQKVRPSVEALCELAKTRTAFAVNPSELRINYYRAPQGVN